MPTSDSWPPSSSLRKRQHVLAGRVEELAERLAPLAFRTAKLDRLAYNLFAHLTRIPSLRPADYSGLRHPCRIEAMPMRTTLTATTCRRLDIQGFGHVDEATLATVAPWLRLAFALCAVLAGLGTALASPLILLVLFPIALLAALIPVHPFDLLYNYGVRFLTGTGPLPRRGPRSRFACGLGAVWLLPTAWAFATGRRALGYILGAALTSVAVLVSTTDICLPSLLYRSLFGFPPRRQRREPPAA